MLTEVVLLVTCVFMSVEFLEFFDYFNDNIVDLIFLKLHGQIKCMIILLSKFVKITDFFFGQT